MLAMKCDSCDHWLSRHSSMFINGLVPIIIMESALICHFAFHRQINAFLLTTSKKLESLCDRPFWQRDKCSRRTSRIISLANFAP